MLNALQNTGQQFCRLKNCPAPNANSVFWRNTDLVPTLHLTDDPIRLAFQGRCHIFNFVLPGTITASGTQKKLSNCEV